jgi:heptosyltransferase-2
MKIVLTLPNWVGDVVMATPALRALRRQFPDAEVTALVRPYAYEVIDPCPLVDALVRAGPHGMGFLAARRFLREGRFDVGVLLTNSFRSALLLWTGKVVRRIGYARDRRGWMLTDRLAPRREGRRFAPVPAIDYYLAIAGRLGCRTDDRRMELHVAESDRQAVEAAMTEAAVAADRPVVLITPGAAFGSAKCYPPEQFAAAADRIAEATGAQILLTAAPDEQTTLERILAAMSRPAVNMAARIRGLGALKALVQRCDVLITNDSGPRHIAAALGRPVVSIFGPTDPEWARIDCPAETILQARIDHPRCGGRKCPRDHRCMTKIDPQRVAAAAIERLQPSGESA